MFEFNFRLINFIEEDLFTFIQETPFWFLSIVLFCMFFPIGFMLRALVTRQRATETLICTLYITAIFLVILFCIYKFFVI